MSVPCVLITWLLTLPVLFHGSLQEETRNSGSISETHVDRGPRSAEPGAASCTSRELTKLRLLTVLPYPNNTVPVYFRPSWDQGLNILPAIELAVEQINNRSDILPCHQLELINVDGGCEVAPKISLGIVNNLYGQSDSRRDREHEAIAGVIGPGCSISTLRMSAITNRPEVELVILHDAGSPLLADRTKYKNSIGILGSVHPLVELSIQLMKMTGWHNIAILYDSTRLYHLITAERFISGLKNDVNILFQAPIYSYFYPLLEIQASLARIIYLFVPSQYSQRIMCLAYHWKLIYPGYQWVLVGHNITSSFQKFILYYDGKQYNCSYEALINTSLSNSFMINYQLADELSDKPLLNMSFYEFQKLYEARIRDFNYKNSNVTIAQTYWAYNMYDAAWAWALVLDNLTSRHSKLIFEYGNKTLANMILNKFYSIEFQGMSGRISFNSSNGFINRQAILYQIVQGSEKTITSSRSEMNTSFPQIVAIPDIVTVTGLPHIELVCFFVILHCLEFISVVVIHLFTAAYRKSKSVKASSPYLSQLVFLGLYFFILSTLALSISNATSGIMTSRVICQLLWDWLFPFSFTLIVGTVTVRTWRLYRIFIHYRNPGRFISTHTLVIFVLILLFVNLLIVITRIIVDPIQLTLVYFVVENGPANELIQDRICQSRRWNLLWIVISDGYRILLLVVLVTLTLLMRKIPNKTFTLGAFSYIFSMIYLLGFTAYYVFLFTSHKPNVIYSILSLTFDTMICLVIVFIVLPPLIPIAREKIPMKRCWNKIKYTVSTVKFCNMQR